MPTFQDLQSLALWRMRDRGVNFGGATTNSSTDQDPPYLIGLLLNLGQQEFTMRTKEAQIATVKINFLTTSNMTSAPLRPVPENTGTSVVNPAALRVWEVTYTSATVNANYEYNVELVNTQRFKYLSGDYTRRLSWFGPRFLYAARLYREPAMQFLPGAANAGDTVAFTITPDFENSPSGVSAANGGLMVNAGDYPFIPFEYHMALVDYVVANAGLAVDMAADVKAANDRWNAKILEALQDGATEDGGEAVVVQDKYVIDVLRNA